MYTVISEKETIKKSVQDLLVPNFEVFLESDC